MTDSVQLPGNSHSEMVNIFASFIFALLNLSSENKDEVNVMFFICMKIIAHLYVCMYVSIFVLFPFSWVL